MPANGALVKAIGHSGIRHDFPALDGLAKILVGMFPAVNRCLIHAEKIAQFAVYQAQ